MAKSLEEIEAEFRARFSGEQAKSLAETEVPVPPEAESLTEAEKPVPPEEELPMPPEEELLVLPEEGLPVPGEEEMQVEAKASKAAIVSDVLFYFALIAMVVCAVLFSRGAFGQQTFGGYRFYEVLTTSMESVYSRGSLVLIKEADVDELVVGDDITFAKDSANIITHRIVEIIEDYDGSGGRGFVTKGVENSAVDGDIVTADNVIGKVVRGIPGLGRILRLLGENLWIILVFFILLIACSFFLKVFFREGREKGDNAEKVRKVEKVEKEEIKDKLLTRWIRFRNNEEEKPPKKEEQEGEKEQ